MRKLTTSLASLKESQAEAHSVLPRPQPYKEPAKFGECQSVADILRELGEKDPVMEGTPPVSLLRCGIEDYRKGKEGDLVNPTTEELFRYLEGQMPWLTSEEGLKYEASHQKTMILYAPLRLCCLAIANVVGDAIHLSSLHGNIAAASFLYQPRKPGRLTTDALDIYGSHPA